MLLTIDIGNTNIAIGIFKGKRLITHWRIVTQAERTADEYYLIFKNLFAEAKIRIEGIKAIIICSVVPKALSILKETIKRLFKVKGTVIILGENLEVPIKNLYHNPKQVGQDRLANAFAGYTLYGSPLIIIDFGTAITFDLVSSKGEYLGGIIAPGIEISLEALSQRTALLPHVELAKPKGLIGKDTMNSIRSGIFYGFSGLCDGLVKRLKEELGKNTKVVATGGQAEIIATYCQTIDKVNKLLTLEGLRLIYENYKNVKNSILKRKSAFFTIILPFML
jgi:type III pantothenate kinase